MPLTVHQFPCLSDNYGFLIRDEATGQAACIDTPDAAAILRELNALGWTLTHILNTHWHPDHAGGNAEIQAATGCVIVGPAEVERLGNAPDRVVGDGDVVMLGETRFDVIDTGGHTLGHITFYDAADRIAFVGDTLFALGCGRLFEGTPQQMWTSLRKLTALPDDTTVYCAHEYTASNARFALSVDESAALKARAGRSSPPASGRMDRAHHHRPGKGHQPLPARALLRPDIADPAEAFGAVRAAKDSFQG